MAEWVISGNPEAVYIDNGGSVSFTGITQETAYTITYKDDNGCEGKKTVRVIPRDKVCDCSNVAITGIANDIRTIESDGGQVEIGYRNGCAYGSISGSSYPEATVNTSTTKVTFSFGKNETANDKTYKCRVWLVGNESCAYEFTVIQKGDPKAYDDDEKSECGCDGIWVAMSSTVSHSGGTIDVPYSRTCSNGLDLVVGPVEGENYLTGKPIFVGNNISFNFKENTGSTQNKVVYYIGYAVDKNDPAKDIICSYFTITQIVKKEEFVEGCDCRSAELTVKADSSTIPYSAKTVDVTYSFKCPTDEAIITCGGVNGIKWETGTSKVTITVDENSGKTSREFWCEVRLKNTGCSERVFITQNSKVEIKEECDFDKFTIDIDSKYMYYDLGTQKNTTGGTFTLECNQTEFIKVCSVKHCCQGDVTISHSPVGGWLDVKLEKEESASGCTSTIYAKTKSENNSGNNLYGAVNINIESSYGYIKNDKWRIPLMCEYNKDKCPKEEEKPCANAICGEIRVNAFGPFRASGGNKLDIAEIGYMHPECTTIKEISVTGSENAFESDVNTVKDSLSFDMFYKTLTANLPDLSECDKYVGLEDMVYYDFEVTYGLGEDLECKYEFTISQYRNTDECPCECEGALEYTVLETPVGQNPEGEVMVLSNMSVACGNILGVTSGTLTGIRIEGDKVYAMFPDLTECGQRENPIRHTLKIEYSAELSACEEKAYVFQEANAKECCGCNSDAVIFTEVITETLPQIPGCDCNTSVTFKEIPDVFPQKST